MELWLDGPGVRQWRRSAKGSKPTSRDNTERQQQRCIELAADGQYAKATKALVSSGLLGRDVHTEKAMRDKHPIAQDAPDLSDLAAPA